MFELTHLEAIAAAGLAFSATIALVLYLIRKAFHED
jgi:hypothetical protein